MTGDGGGGGDLVSIEDRIDHSCRVENAVVFVDEMMVDVHEALLRCTRILVRVGEIGKYSISESSVDKVSPSLVQVLGMPSKALRSYTLPPKDQSSKGCPVQD